MDRVIKSVGQGNQVYKPGDVLFEEGSIGETFFIIKRGTVKIIQGKGKPEEKFLASIAEGHVLGEVSAVDGGPRTASAVAETEVEVSQVDGRTLKYQIKQCPHWFAAIVLDLVERLRRTDELLSSKGINHAARHTSEKATATDKEEDKDDSDQKSSEETQSETEEQK